jgi:quercetin dioxygenase-like cupin family protein
MKTDKFVFNQENEKQPGVLSGGLKNLWTRIMYFRKAGDYEETHAHNFDHLTILSTGKLKLTVNNKDTICEAPMQIYLQAGLEHRFEALEDNTIATCVHALRNKDGVDLLDPDSIPEGVTFSADAGHEV